MIDNGLLKYYSKYSDEFGRLRYDNIKKAGIKNISHRRPIIKSRIREGLFRKGDVFYYQKQLGGFYSKDRNEAEDFVDAEVLLSQIYAKAGFNTAIYLPTIDKDNLLGVVSNDISTKQSETMHDFYNLIMCNPYEYGKGVSEKDLKLQQYFEEKAFRDYVRMHVFDVACGNTDRHGNNLFVDVKKTESGLLVAEEVSLFDYGHSICYLNNLYNLQVGSYCFCNGLGNGNIKTKQEMIEEFKNNEYVNMFYTPVQLSEMLGNIDVVGTAKDIKQTTNYEIDDDLVTKFARLIDDTAESLIK